MPYYLSVGEVAPKRHTQAKAPSPQTTPATLGPGPAVAHSSVNPRN
jgi:hypothetical protein